jgi:preprotein translocase subunit YajC
VHTTLSVLSHAANAASTGSSSSKGGSIVPFVVLIGLFGVAYLAFIRPARNRQRAAVQQRRQASVGDEVTTTAGLLATVVAVDEDYLTLEIAPGVHCRYLPAAILRINNDDEEPYGDEDEDAASRPDASTHEVIETPTEPTTDTSGGSTTDPTDGTTSA